MTYVIAAAVSTAACGDSPIAPTPQPPPTPPPTVAAPLITALTVATTSRVEAGQDVALTATVVDSAPTLRAPSYVWSVNVGTVTGSGTTAIWRLAPGTISAGADVIVRLTVVKPYDALVNGQLVTLEHRVTRDAASFRAHDSRAEISRIVLTFLIDYFGNYAVSPDACLVDFTESCPGKSAERTDIVNNRKDRRILSAEATVQSVAFNAANNAASVVAPCVFRDIEVATGLRFTVSGDCLLNAVYEQQRWWLCDSNFRARSVTSPAFGGFEPSRAIGAGRYWD